MQETMRIALAVVFKGMVLLLIFLLFRNQIGFTFSKIKLSLAQVGDIVGSVSLLVAIRMFLIYVYELSNRSLLHCLFSFTVF